MQNNLMRILLTLWCGGIGVFNSLIAAPNHGERDSTRAAIVTTPRSPEATPTMLRSFPELEQYLKDNNLHEPTLLHQGYAAAPEFTAGYIAQNFAISDFIADTRGEAQATMTEIDRKNNYTDFLSNNDLVDLPVGMKKKLGNSSVTIGVSKAKFFPTYTELTVFCKIDLPQGKSIYFGANNVKLSHGGGLVGDANLVLLGDFQIPINGGNSMITLKGGMDMATGNVQNLTYAKLECGGVKEVGLAADVSFPRSLLTPLNPDYTVVSDPSVKVKGTFTTIVSDWNDILANISLQPFALKGLEKVAFQLQNAVVDLSDTRNDGSVQFPQGYGNLVPGNENLWRGVYIRQLSVILPKEFKKKGTSERVTFTGERLLIDNWGFTGLVSATNIMQNGTATGWDFSVDKFSLEVQSNRLRAAGFEGSIALPVSKRTSSNVRDYGLAYKAIFSADNGYLMNVSVQNELDFNLWQAKGTLFAGSYINLVVKDDKFRPKAYLNGELNLNINTNGTQEAEFKGITFQGLQLQTEAPYFQADYFGYQSQSKIANFPITINQLGIRTGQNNEISLVAGIALNLMEASANKFSASTNISVVGEIIPSEEEFRYDYKRLEVNQIAIEATFKDAFYLKGSVNFFRNHQIMGNGFSGTLDMELLSESSSGLGIKATAAFGSREFRYWYVDALASGLNIPIGGLVITGLGGGASYKMKKNTSSTDPSVCASGIGYDPDAGTGLGLRAMTTFKIGGKMIGTGDAALEMVFTSSGGLGRVGFHGKATFLPSGTVKAEFLDVNAVKNRVQGKLTSFTSAVNSNIDDYRYLMENGQYKQAATSYTPASTNPYETQGSIVATVGIEYDFQSRVLDGNFEVYVNLANGMIRGTGYNDLAGYAKLRFTPTKWYVHMGTPQNPIGVRMAIGPASIVTGTYFMVGDSLGASPPPPAEVASLLGTKLQALDYMRNLNDLGTGRGLAFGSKVNLNTGYMNWLLFYAQFQAGIGFDIMVKDYGDRRCVGYSDPIGMNGWYANGQAYAYLQGELGIRVRLFFIKKDIAIIKAGAAVLLQAKMPKPTWFSGQVAGRYSLLGGVVSGGFSCKINFGDNCEINNNGASSSSQFDYITDFVPTNNEEEVDVMGVPQAVFRLPIESPFMGEVDDQGNATYYGARLDEFSVTKDGVPVAGQLNWNKSRETVFFESNEALPANSTLRAKVRVSFYRVVNGYSWQPLYQYEEKDITFKTGSAPAGIPLTNIAYAYPVVGQKYYYPSEHNQGFIKLKRGQSYLLDNALLKVKLTANGSTQTIDGGYNQYNRTITFPMTGIATGQSYNIEIVNDAAIQNEGVDYTNAGVTTSTNGYAADGSSVQMSENLSSGMMTRAATTNRLLSYNFSTSYHQTFAQKMQAKCSDNGYPHYQYTEDFGLGNTAKSLARFANWDEGFDIAELVGNKYTGLKPLIEPEATMSDNYYAHNIEPTLYSWNYREGFELNREIPNLGIPPTKAIQVSSSYIATLENPDPNDWWSGMSVYYNFPYIYRLPKFYYEDFQQLQNAAIQRYGTAYERYVCYDEYGNNTSNLNGYDYNNYYPTECYYEMHHPYPWHLYNLIAEPFPTMPSGTYSATFRYTLPNGAQTSSFETNYNYTQSQD